VTIVAVALLSVAFAASADSTVRVHRMHGYSAPGTPKRLNRVTVIEVGPPSARNVLVLEPGTSAGGAYFVPLAQWVVQTVPGWQVWSIERRENLLEDQSMIDLAKEGKATSQAVFDYYLGYLTNPSVTTHFQFIPDASVAYARQWGLHVAIEDLHRVIAAAKRHGGRVVLGGHSLGGSVVTAYATWDFHGRAGAQELAGLVYDDGGSHPAPIAPDSAAAALLTLQTSTPWLAFGGIPAPFAGIYNATGSTGALVDPNSPSLGQAFALLPADLKPPVPATNLGQYGYALNVGTSPPALWPAQAHLGHLDTSVSPAGWDSTGALTPIQRFATMFSGTGLKGIDGTEWYFPERLTIDEGAVAEGNANPAQAILDVHATHGSDLPQGLRIFAFGAHGGQAILDAATTLANQSQIPSGNLTLVNREGTYAHNDPAAAYPTNDFFTNLVQFLTQISQAS
jgi:hypothetical protein